MGFPAAVGSEGAADIYLFFELTAAVAAHVTAISFVRFHYCSSARLRLCSCHINKLPTTNSQRGPGLVVSQGKFTSWKVDTTRSLTTRYETVRKEDNENDRSPEGTSGRRLHSFVAARDSDSDFVADLPAARLHLIAAENRSRSAGGRISPHPSRPRSAFF